MKSRQGFATRQEDNAKKMHAGLENEKIVTDTQTFFEHCAVNSSWFKPQAGLFPVALQLRDNHCHNAISAPEPLTQLMNTLRLHLRSSIPVPAKTWLLKALNSPACSTELVMPEGNRHTCSSQAA